MFCTSYTFELVLYLDCSNPKFVFTYTGKSFQLKGKCLRPLSFRWAERTPLIIYSGCNTYESTYQIIDIVKGRLARGQLRKTKRLLE